MAQAQANAGKSRDPWTFAGGLAQTGVAAYNLSQAEKAEAEQRTRAAAQQQREGDALAAVMLAGIEGYGDRRQGGGRGYDPNANFIPGGRDAALAALADNPEALRAQGANLGLGYATQGPAPEPETWETVRDASGNPLYQQSSLSGQTREHHGKVEPTAALEYKTKDDQHGVPRFVDGPNAGQPVFPDVQSAAVAAAASAPSPEVAEADPLSASGKMLADLMRVEKELGADHPDSKVLRAVYEATAAANEKDPKFDRETKIRTEWRLGTKVFRDTQDNYRRIATAAGKDSPSANVALVFAFMKMLDPESTVRETEQASIENARGVPETIRNLWNKVFSGERLTEDQRAEISGLAGELYLGQLEAVEQRRAEYNPILEEYGLNPLNALPFAPSGKLVDLVRPKDASAGGASGAAPVTTGVSPFDPGAAPVAAAPVPAQASSGAAVPTMAEVERMTPEELRANFTDQQLAEFSAQWRASNGK